MMSFSRSLRSSTKCAMLVGIACICAFALAVMCSCGLRGSSQDSQSDSASQSSQSQPEMSKESMATEANSDVASKHHAAVGDESDLAKAAQSATVQSGSDTPASPQGECKTNISVKLTDADFTDENRTGFVLYMTVTNTGDTEFELASALSLTARQSASRQNPLATYVLGAYAGKNKSGGTVPSDNIILAPGESAPYVVGWYLAEGEFLGIELAYSDSDQSQFFTFDI